MVKWCIAIGLHAVWLFLFLYLWNTGGIGNLNYDSLSVSLSILQTSLVIFGFISFGYIAVMADRAAKETARKAAEDMVKSELPALVKREMQELRDLTKVLGTQPDMPQQAADSLDGDSK